MRRLALVAFALLFASGCSSCKRFAYEGFNRDDWQHPDRVIEELGISPGDIIADIGAGGGYFTFLLADAVGPEGTVYAVDVDEDMTSYLEERAAEDGYENVKVVLGEFANPLLPDGEIDLVFTVDTYHHIQERPAYFEQVQKHDLAPNGRIAIIELNDASWFPRTFGHNTPREVIVSELGDAGCGVDRQLDFIERQHFLIFKCQ